MVKLANLTSKYRAKLIAESYNSWLKPNESVLDVGCGTGIVAKELEKLLNIKAAGCDIDKYLTVIIPFKKMKGFDKLPNFNKKFDASMFNDMLHHTNYKNQPNLVIQAMKISKRCLIFELKPTILGKIADYLINKIHNPNMNIPYTYRTPQEWKKLFREMGYKHQVQEVHRPFWYPFSHIAFRVSR